MTTENPSMEILSKSDRMTEEEFQTLNRLESIVETESNLLLESAKRIGDCLRKIHDSRSWKKLNPDGSGRVYEDFGEYAMDRFKKGRTQAYNYMKVANVMNFLNDGGVDNAEVGTINAAIALNNETKKIVKIKAGPFTALDEFSKTILLTGWKAVVATAPIDEKNNPIVTVNHIHNVFEVMREVVDHDVLEIDGEPLPVSAATTALKGQVLMQEAERIKALNQYIVEKYEQRRRRLAEPIKTRSAVFNATQLFTIQCPKHGEVQPYGLIRGGFLCKCGCKAIFVTDHAIDKMYFALYEDPEERKKNES